MAPGRIAASARPVQARGPSPAGEGSGGRTDRRTVLVIATVQMAIGLGFYSVFAHVVAHMRDGVGLAAGTIGIVLGARLLIQYALLLPVGALTDALGAPRAGTFACAVRACGFALLGAADGVAGLAAAAVLLGAGGALYHPAAQSVVAGLPPARRSGGYGTYLISGHVSAVIGPPAGLLLLGAGGFPALAAAAAAAWGVAAALFLLLPAARREPGPPARKPARGRSASRALAQGIAAVGRDRPFLRFAVIAAPSTLLVGATTTVVPLKGFTSGWTTLFFCAAAAVLSGLGAGLMQPSIFQVVARHAPPEQVGAYLGTSSFLAGMVAFAGALAIGALFDAGSAGAAAALTGLAVLALLAACARRRRSP